MVTNPDKAGGRGMTLRPSPVKEAARAAGIPIFQPPSARGADLERWLVHQEPDVAVVVAYGKILPPRLLEIPRLGFVNLHFSVLPAYRGAAPVQHALIDGCAETGVSTMLLTEGMDEGPVLASTTVPVDAEETAGELGARLALVGAPLLLDSLDRYAAGTLRPREQDHARATYAPKISNEETRIDWGRPADDIKHLVHGLSPDPGAWTSLRGQRMKLLRARSTPAAGLSPGELRADRALLVGTGEGILEILEAQPAGKRKMAGEDVARGLRAVPGERFE